MTVMTELEIENATVYNSDDIRAIYKAIYAYWNALPKTYIGIWKKSGGTEVSYEYKRKREDLLTCPIFVRGYSPTKAEKYGAAYYDSVRGGVILKIQSPKKLPQSALVALAQCANDDGSSLDRRVLVSLVNMIRISCGLRDAQDTGDHDSRIVADFKLRLRYGAKPDAAEIKRQKTKDLLLRHTKLLQRETWSANEIYECEKLLEKRRKWRTDIKRKINDIERKLNAL